jgi:hypothetical protein
MPVAKSSLKLKSTSIIASHDACAAPFSAGKTPSLAAVSIHLKGWIQSRLEELAGIFAVDVLGFSVMCNHIHQLLRKSPRCGGRLERRSTR